MADGSTEYRVSGAGSSRKLLSALLCFTEQRPTWTVAALSSELDLSATSTYRYVALLREVGLLEGAPDSGRTGAAPGGGIRRGRRCHCIVDQWHECFWRP